MKPRRDVDVRSCALATALSTQQWVFRILCIVASDTALADSWSLPTPEIYSSADGSKRLTVYPRELSNQLDYFSDKVEGIEPAGQRRAASTATATAMLESKAKGGKWALMWHGPLLNNVSPVSALVSNSGHHVVTFDNWHEVGYGEHVVVIYGDSGRLIRSLSLSDFLPDAYIAAVPRSVSSLWWRSYGATHQFDDLQSNVVLHVAEPFEYGHRRTADDNRFVKISVSLANGNVTLPHGPMWDALLSRAERTREMIDAERDERRRRLLYAPATDSETDWQMYLSQAFGRASEEKYMRTAGSCFPTEDELSESNAIGRVEACLEEAKNCVRDTTCDGGELAFGSADSTRLAHLLAESLTRIQSADLKGLTVYFIGDEASGNRVSNALQHTGARFQLIDTSKPVPPRAEGIGE